MPARSFALTRGVTTATYAPMCPVMNKSDSPVDTAKLTDSNGSGFDQFALAPHLLRTVRALGFETPTPIQRDAIPMLLSGRDVIGRARTGSGKTAAFGLPLLNGITEMRSGVRALVLAPTRELAVQVTNAIRDYAAESPIRVSTIYGGVAYERQLRDLRSGTPVIVGTPGRLLDHLDRGSLDLSDVELLVIDEADEMLRMGFIDDVTRLLGATPVTRQVALFSATMPRPIRRVADAYLTDPVEVQVESRALTVDHIEQRGMIVPERNKLEALERLLLAEPFEAALVFARTRLGCSRLAEELAARGLDADALHGDMNQAARERVFQALRERRLSIVVATDVAARGIDVAHITHVINVNLPTDTESYVHRIGRTGRAGRKGTAITFVTPMESRRLGALEHELRVRIAPMPVPTDADILRRRQYRLSTEFRSPESGDGTAGAYLDHLVAKTGLSEREVATRAIELLAAERSISLDQDADETPPHWTRPPKKSAPRMSSPNRPTRTNRMAFDSKAVALFLPIGRNQGVRPADIVWGLTSAAGIPAHLIGRITLHGRNSFVGLAPDVAKHVLQSVKTVPIRGEEVPVSIARIRSNSEQRAQA